MQTPILYEERLPVLKRDRSGRNLPVKLKPGAYSRVGEVGRSSSVSAMALNNLAKEYPFCVMYHTKKNDPL